MLPLTKFYCKIDRKYMKKKFHCYIWIKRREYSYFLITNAKFDHLLVEMFKKRKLLSFISFFLWISNLLSELRNAYFEISVLLYTIRVSWESCGKVNVMFDNQKWWLIMPETWVSWGNQLSLRIVILIRAAVHWSLV